MNISEVLQFLFPFADSVADWSIDGDSQTIFEWNLDEAQPTLEYLTEVSSSDEFVEWKIARDKDYIDLKTATAIDLALHPYTPIEEQLGIIRNALVILLNALGIEASADLYKWNEIAIAKIEEGQLEKKVIDA